MRRLRRAEVARAAPSVTVARARPRLYPLVAAASRPLSVAAVAAVAVASAAADAEREEAEEVLEAVTGARVPAFVEDGEGGARLGLVGVGPRRKALAGGLFKVSVYAAAVYAEGAEAIRAAWPPGEGADARAAAVLDAPGTKRLRLAMVREVGAAAMRKALVEALAPKVEEVAGVPFADISSCAAFEEMVGSLDTLSAGSRLEFTWRRGGVLETRLDGAVAGVTQSALLARALFEVYLGREPCSDEVKAGILGV